MEISEDSELLESFRVLIKHSNGSEDEVFVFPNYTVRQLKVIICSKKNLDFRKMDLIFNGSRIEDNKCLADLNIHKNHSIYSVYGCK
jgi:hypothetical protein